MPRGPKITYTYNGITFSTASKVVAQRAASGNIAGAYKRYVSDTLGRSLRAGHQSKGMRQQYLRSVEAGKGSVTEIREKSRELEKIVRDKISGDIQNQYQDVFAQLNDSQDPTVRKLAKRVREIIDKNADKYRPENAMKANRAIMRAIDKAKTDISEQGMHDLEAVSDTVERIRSQISIKDKMRTSRLKDRRQK